MAMLLEKEQLDLQITAQRKQTSETQSSLLKVEETLSTQRDNVEREKRELRSL